MNAYVEKELRRQMNQYGEFKYRHSNTLKSRPSTVTRSTPCGIIEIVDHVGCYPEEVLYPCSYANQIDYKINYKIELGANINSDYSYRSEMFSRGIHLGHHLGPIGKINCNDLELKLYLHNANSGDYQKALWRYALKIGLSVIAYHANALHLKAVTLANKSGKGVLLVGRGKSGKSTLAMRLKNHGLLTLGNTHALIKEDRAWGIQTWQRIREEGRDKYIPPNLRSSHNDCILCAIIIVEHNTSSQFKTKVLPPEHAQSYIQSFSYAIGTYDLKEDILDALARQGATQIDILNNSMRILESTIRDIPTYWLSSDVLDETCLMQTSKFIDSLI